MDQVQDAVNWCYANGIQIITHANGEGAMHTFYWGDWHRDHTVGPVNASDGAQTIEDTRSGTHLANAAGMSKGLVLGVVLTLLVGVIAWLTVVYTGAYDVAATDPHADAVRWTLETTMHRSVASRAGDVELPDLSSRALIEEGAGHYGESCVHCHGAPGQDPAEWSRGMRPEPPHLVQVAADWTPEEIHWIVENGIKMSGMPAFGPAHGPDAVVAITAFVKQLPGLSREDYARLTSDGGHTHGNGHGATSAAPAHGHAPDPQRDES